MPLFRISRKSLALIKEKPFKLEKEIQVLTEANLNVAFNLEYVCSEFQIDNLRMDTLAYDKSAKAFVVIEFKRDRSFSVVDQGYAYLAMMLNNKADFILEYNERKNRNLKRTDIDWSQSKVIFISPAFTTYQRESINFKDLPIELWEIKRYDNDTVSYSRLQSQRATESIQTVSSQDKAIEQVSREMKVYTEKDHTSYVPEDIQEIYQRLKERLLEIGNVEVKPKKYYIGFVARTNFVDAHLQKKAIKLWLNLPKGTLDDPKHIARDVSNVGHWGNGDYEIILNTDADLDYLMALIKQSYKRNSD